MNKEGILNLEVVELDMLIATKVMGWKIDESESVRCEVAVVEWIEGSEEVWRWFSPTKDIKDAWEVVEKIKLKLQIFTYFHNAEGFEDGWCVKIDGKHVEGIENAPEAICKAALLAVMDS